MLRVSYLKTYGYINVLANDNKTILKTRIHPCNGLFGCIWHDRKNKLAHLVTFACDMKHLKNCLKDQLDIENFKKIVIYTNTDWKERFKVAEMFQKYGYNIEMKQAKKWQKHAKKKTISK